MCKNLIIFQAAPAPKKPRYPKKIPSWFFEYNIQESDSITCMLDVLTPGCDRPSSPLVDDMLFFRQPGIPTNKPAHLPLEFWYPRHSVEEIDGDGW